MRHEILKVGILSFLKIQSTSDIEFDKKTKAEVIGIKVLGFTCLES